MTLSLPRWLLLLLLCFVPCGLAAAEKVADLPVPTHYVNDFAGVLSPQGARQIEDLCLAVHRQANAEIAVVTIKQLEDGQSIEDFSAKLEEKWKLGKAGEDRSVLFLIVLKPHGLRMEIGYGLEGILNDAKVGAILDQVKPLATQGDFDQAALTGVQGLAKVIATDAGVTLQPIAHYQRQAQPAPAQLGVGQIILGVAFVILIIILIRTGHIGWVWFLLSMFFNGGGGGRGGGGFGGGDDDGGGGFGGVGGGGSGGGGASRDF